MNVKMGIVGFTSPDEIIKEINRLLDSKLILFYIVTTKDSIVDFVAWRLGIPTLYIQSLEELEKQANFWLIKDNGNADINRLVLRIKKRPELGLKVIKDT